jgi:GDP-4-dehydro-6-deoxy-D-mannose reductase
MVDESGGFILEVTSMKKLLLTGSNGFVGKVLLEYLLIAGYQVTCVTASPVKTKSVDLASIHLDIRNKDAVEDAIKKIKPTHLVHLAAISDVASSFSDPFLTWETNVLGTVNILEAIKRHSPDCFALFASSSEVYGSAFKSGVPLDEESKCHPLNPYAASKLAAEAAINQYLDARLVQGVIARPFNHIGPGQSPNFVTASFAKQIAMIEANKQESVIKVGNLEASRDFLDVHDVCLAYIKLLEGKSSLRHSTYNICSGKAYKISRLLDIMLNQSSASISVELDPLRLRPSDIPFAVGNNKRIVDDTGWHISRPIEDTLASLLNHWRLYSTSLNLHDFRS